VKALVDITGVMMDAEAVQAIKDSTKRDREMVEKTAVVGVTGLKKILADAIAAFSGTHAKYFATKEEALEWLTKS
jgi:threonine synthase